MSYLYVKWNSVCQGPPADGQLIRTRFRFTGHS